jgi:recombination protein RecR
MPDFAEPLARLIAEFKHLPGIGQKSAQRLAFHVLRAPREDAERLSQAIFDVKDKLGCARGATTSAMANSASSAATPIAIPTWSVYWRNRTTSWE